MIDVIILVMLGGAIGTLLRYGIHKLIIRLNVYIAFYTFIVNVVGSFALGFVLTLPLETYSKIFICDGILGAFTTYSTFMTDSRVLYKNKKYFKMMLYIFATIIFGVVGYLVGSAWLK